MADKRQMAGMDAAKEKALENAMYQITREFGAGAIMRLGDMKGKLDIEVIPTGSLALDIAVWCRGISPWQSSRDLWSGVFGKNNIGSSCNCRSSKSRRSSSFY